DNATKPPAMDALYACAQGHPWEHGHAGREFAPPAHSLHGCPGGLRARASMGAWACGRVSRRPRVLHGCPGRLAHKGIHEGMGMARALMRRLMPAAAPGPAQPLVP